MQPFRTGISGISRAFVVITAKSFEEIFHVNTVTRAWKCPRLLRDYYASLEIASLSFRSRIGGISGVNSRDPSIGRGREDPLESLSNPRG